MKRVILLFLSVSFLIIAGCSSDDDNPATPQASPLNGSWYGASTSSTDTTTLSATLSVTGGTISGSATFYNKYPLMGGYATETMSGNVTGSFANDSVKFTLYSVGDSLWYAGKLNNNVISGVVTKNRTDSTYSQYLISLTKQ